MRRENAADLLRWYACPKAALIEERGGPPEKERGNPHNRGEWDEISWFVPLVPVDLALD